MITLTLKDDVAGLLGGYVDAVEIRDEEGRVLGHFLPYLTPQARDVYEHPEKYFDVEEVKRIARDEHGQGRPLTEIWDELGATEKAS